MSERVWTVENKWRCTSCGSENLGRHMECQNCRNPKDTSEVDEAANPNAPKVTDPALLRLANQGANWVCEYCGGQVRDEFGKCVKNCGAPRAAPAPADTAEHAVHRAEETGHRRRAPRPRPPPTTVPGPGVPLYPSLVGEKPLWARIPTWVWLVLGGFALLGGLAKLVHFLVTPWEERVTVASIAWEFKSDLHQKTLEHGEDWGHPYNAFNVSCDRRLKTHRDCNPYQCNPYTESYECNCTSHECNCTTSCRDKKNGFSECRERCSTCRSCSTCTRTAYRTCYERCPVYDDWCSYDYYDWPVVKSLTTNGIAHDERWPALEASGQDQRLDKTARFDVNFAREQGEAKTWAYSPKDMLEFKLFDTGAKWHIEVNHMGSVTPLHRSEQ